MMSRDRIIDKQGHKYIQIKSGRLITFHDALGEARAAKACMKRSFGRAFELASTADLERSSDDLLRGYDLKLIEHFIDELDDYVRAMRSAMQVHRHRVTQQDRITHLRNTTGRTEAEAELYRRKANELEAQS